MPHTIAPRARPSLAENSVLQSVRDLDLADQAHKMGHESKPESLASFSKLRWRSPAVRHDCFVRGTATAYGTLGNLSRPESERRFRMAFSRLGSVWIRAGFGSETDWTSAEAG
jgi:hypothetical protein